MPGAKIIIIAFLYPPCAADKKQVHTSLKSKEIIGLKKARLPLPWQKQFRPFFLKGLSLLN